MEGRRFSCLSLVLWCLEQGETEKTKEDRKRSRSAAKNARRKRRRQEASAKKMEEARRPGGRASKATVEAALRSKQVVSGTVTAPESGTFTKSGKFFSRLQDDIASSLAKGKRGEEEEGGKKRGKGTGKGAAFRL